MEVVSTTTPLNVLFICTGNSARSVMAEAILNRLGRGKFRAFSAGSHPTGRVNPLTLQTLRNAHYDVSEARSKSWEEFSGPDAPKLDFVFTVCDDATNAVSQNSKHLENVILSGAFACEKLQFLGVERLFMSEESKSIGEEYREASSDSFASVVRSVAEIQGLQAIAAEMAEQSRRSMGRAFEI